jgi:hypothetical protein
MLQQDGESSYDFAARVVTKALDEVNAARKALNLPTLAQIPGGKRGDAHGCPMYHALRNGHDFAVMGPRVLVNSFDAGVACAMAWGTDFHGILPRDSDDADWLATNNWDPSEWVTVDAPEGIEEFVTLYDHSGIASEWALIA